MNKINIKAILLITCIIFYLIMQELLIIPYFKTNYNVINITFWTILFIISWIIVGIINIKKPYKKDTISIVIIISLLYLIVIYSLGMVLGFNQNSYSLTLNSIIKNILINIIPIIGIEVTRYAIIKNSSSKINILVSILFGTVYIIYPLCITNFDSNLSILKFILDFYMPSLSISTLLTFMTNKVGVLPSIIYLVITKLYIYIVPIVPNISNSIMSISIFILPYVIILSLYNVYNPNKKSNGIIFYILLVLTVVCLCVTLGIGNYKIISVASNSMLPTLKRGDAVIYKKIDDINNININDILVYSYDGKNIIHRIISIDNNIIYTKGDNNNDMDKPVLNSQIVGVVKMHIPYIGYPSIWLEEIIK